MSRIFPVKKIFTNTLSIHRKLPTGPCSEFASAFMFQSSAQIGCQKTSIAKCLTNRNADMRAAEVGVGLGDGRHSQLVVRSAQETRERRHERNRPVPTRRADRNPDQVLLSDVALDEALRARFLQKRTDPVAEQTSPCSVIGWGNGGGSTTTTTKRGNAGWLISFRPRFYKLILPRNSTERDHLGVFPIS